MSLDLREIHAMTVNELTAKARQNPEWFHELEKMFTLAAAADQKETQIAYYMVANPMALPAHLSTAREIAILGGNRSSKTTTMLAEFAIRMTGHVPMSLLDVYPLEKIRGPIRTRIVCNSLTDTLEPVIKPKLQWNHWNGIGDPTEARGHWGLIPRHCLIGSEWEKAYSEKYRTLRVAFCTLCPVMQHTDQPCRGCDHHLPLTADGRAHRWPERWAGVSSVQMLSYDQDLSAFAGSSMHLVGHDELPPSDVYRENQLRTLDVKGQIITAFTPPDEAGTSRADTSWFFDHVYEPGLAGPSKHPEIDTFVIHTERNQSLSPEDVNAIAARLTDEQREVRLRGAFIHLSGVIFGTFTKMDCTWCFRCSRRILALGAGETRTCPHCHGDNLGDYCHVIDPYPIPAAWPVLMIADPHPRKPDVMGWFAITPLDDLVQIGELEQGGTAKEIRLAVDDYERSLGVYPVKRLGDPNILTQTDDKQRRGETLRQIYDREGLRYDLANDEMNVGIRRVRDLLVPDPHTRHPRFHVFNTCQRSIHSATHWTWDEYTRVGDREPKETPRDKWKDFMDLWRYVANDRPSFHGYKMGHEFTHRRRRK